MGFSGNPAARTGVGLLGPCYKTGRAGTGITPYTFRRTGATRATEAARTAAVARGRPRHPRLLSCQSRPEPRGRRPRVGARTRQSGAGDGGDLPGWGTRPAPYQDCLPVAGSICRDGGRPAAPAGHVARLSQFTPWRFHALCTLSSEFFSTFPHSTCSLSDSRRYLALGGVYHPLRAALPSNPTPESGSAGGSIAGKGLAPALGKPRSRRLARRSRSRSTPTRTLQLPADKGPGGFSAGLFPLHSPLLGESPLVSFPPLTEML